MSEVFRANLLVIYGILLSSNEKLRIRSGIKVLIKISENYSSQLFNMSTIFLACSVLEILNLDFCQY